MTNVSSCTIPSVTKFFSSIENDLSKVTWAHAVNSMSLLEQTISSSSCMMLEADVLNGHLEKEILPSELIPIMAHPPKTISDLSLQIFIDRVIEANDKGKKMGIKLDFKDLDVVITSLEILRNKSSMLTFPLWLNADILKGPGGENKVPVDASIFLSLCTEMFPSATLSLGWTTGYIPGDNLRYTDKMIEEMVNTLKNNNVSQQVTFPVRASFIKHSSKTLKNLHIQNPDSTFTVWTSLGDYVNVEDLANFQNSIGANSVFFDLPDDQMKELRMYYKKSLDSPHHKI